MPFKWRYNIFGKIFNLQNMSVHPTFRLAVLLGIMSVSTYKSAVSIYIMTIATFYWSACTKPEKWTVIYLYVTGIDFDIWFWNCSDSVVLFVFHFFILLSSSIPFPSTTIVSYFDDIQTKPIYSVELDHINGVMVKPKTVILVFVTSPLSTQH